MKDYATGKMEQRTRRRKLRWNWIVNKENSQNFDLRHIESIVANLQSQPLPSTSSSVIFSEYQSDFSLLVVLRLYPCALTFALLSSQQIHRLCLRFIHLYRLPLLFSSSLRRYARFASFFNGYHGRLDWNRGPCLVMARRMLISIGSTRSTPIDRGWLD